MVVAGGKDGLPAFFGEEDGAAVLLEADHRYFVGGEVDVGTGVVVFFSVPFFGLDVLDDEGSVPEIAQGVDVHKCYGDATDKGWFPAGFCHASDEDPEGKCSQEVQAQAQDDDAFPVVWGKGDLFDQKVAFEDGAENEEGQ